MREWSEMGDGASGSDCPVTRHACRAERLPTRVWSMEGAHTLSPACTSAVSALVVLVLFSCRSWCPCRWWSAGSLAGWSLLLSSAVSSRRCACRQSRRDARDECQPPSHRRPTRMQTRPNAQVTTRTPTTNDTNDRRTCHDRHLRRAVTRTRNKRVFVLFSHPVSLRVSRDAGAVASCDGESAVDALGAPAPRVPHTEALQSHSFARVAPFSIA